MVDFSHYRDHFYRPEAVAKISGKSPNVTDEMLLEIFRRIDPPLLDQRSASTVTALLERRRGRRPSRGLPSITFLARRIARLDRPDVHPGYLAVLSARVAAKSGISENDRASRFQSDYDKKQRDDVIRRLYWQLRSLIAENPEVITHPLFGEVKVPPGLRPRQQAAEMTGDFLRGQWDGPVPSDPTILRIASM